MKRMTTDNPQLNIERLLNMARAENNQAVLHLGDEVVTLTEYVVKYAKEMGCDVTPESVMDGDNCTECDCPVAILNLLGIQAAENNARLKNIEKILGNDYDLDRLREMVNADQEGRCVVLPIKLGDTIYSIREDFYNYRKHSGVRRGEVVGFEYDKTWMIWVHLDDDTPKSGIAFKVKDFGKVIFNNLEKAESALKMKERKNNGS